MSQMEGCHMRQRRGRGLAARTANMWLQLGSKLDSGRFPCTHARAHTHKLRRPPLLSSPPAAALKGPAGADDGSRTSARGEHTGSAP